MTVKLTEQFLGIAFVRRRVAEILSRFLDFSMPCRQENFPPAIFGASHPSMATRPTPGRDPGLRSDGELPPAVEILSAFLDLSMVCKQDNFPPASFGAPRPSTTMRAVPERGAFVRRSPRSAARPNTRCSGLEASETIPFPGPDSIFSSRCGAISGQVRPSLTMRPVSEQARCFHRERVRTARSRNGDRVRPSRDHHGDKPSRDRGLVVERVARTGQCRNARAWAGSEPRTTICYDNMNFVLRKSKI
jgi:hypothetical protein